MPHQIDDAVKFVCFKGQHPLIVTERKAGHRIGPYVGIFSAHLAMLGQHPTPFGILHEIPHI